MIEELIKGLTRKDIPEYPPIAIREAIVNAIVHADYSIRGVCLSIAIFNNRIEITNPGALPFGFTIEKALDGSSRIRNRVIAKVFHHLKWIEQWGRGLQLIVKECGKHGLVSPKFEELNNQFRVTLFATKRNHTKQHDESEEKLVKYLEKKKTIGTKDAAAIWKITPRAARLRLIKLVNAGIIKKTGTYLQDPKGVYLLACQQDKD